MIVLGLDVVERTSWIRSYDCAALADDEEGYDDLGVAGEIVEDGICGEEKAVTCVVYAGVGGGEELEYEGCGVWFVDGILVLRLVWGIRG